MLTVHAPINTKSQPCLLHEKGTKKTSYDEI